jgi:hypothetical protein
MSATNRNDVVGPVLVESERRAPPRGTNTRPEPQIRPEEPGGPKIPMPGPEMPAPGQPDPGEMPITTPRWPNVVR